MVSVEHGSAWIPSLLGDLDHVMRHTMPSTIWPGGKIDALPSEIFREHVSVSPFYEPHYEAPMKELVALVGIERLWSSARTGRTGRARSNRSTTCRISRDSRRLMSSVSWRETQPSCSDSRHDAGAMRCRLEREPMNDRGGGGRARS